MSKVIRDPRMQARADYTEARKEAFRRHAVFCAEIGIEGDEVEATFKAWLDGWEFDIASDGKGGSYLCMTRGRLPEGGLWDPDTKKSLMDGGFEYALPQGVE
jgi:hypothetical protein